MPPHSNMIRRIPSLAKLCFYGGVIEKVLVPLDGSEVSEKSIRKAQELLKGAAPHGRIIALMVLELPKESPLFEPIDLENARNEERRQASRYLTELREQFVFDDCEFETRIAESNDTVAEMIIEQAELEKVDLIALTTHGRTGLKRVVFGSVAEKVLRMAPCSVVIVR